MIIGFIYTWSYDQEHLFETTYKEVRVIQQNGV